MAQVTEPRCHFSLPTIDDISILKNGRMIFGVFSLAYMVISKKSDPTVFFKKKPDSSRLLDDKVLAKGNRNKVTDDKNTKI